MTAGPPESQPISFGSLDPKAFACPLVKRRWAQMHRLISIANALTPARYMHVAVSAAGYALFITDFQSASARGAAAARIGLAVAY